MVFDTFLPLPQSASSFEQLYRHDLRVGLYVRELFLKDTCDFSFKGVVNCQNSRDKGPPEGYSARG